ncbi:solute carrier organic anion transporter family member 2B1-like [Branchiostoma floridae]|uniref:Solute carrier organic anion transporter family member 2B1-like n=1 Tax=Branchiostoma floridae TaxID=7739 RepID=A0A9J7KT68_BRAFL|nr:solute carrier organic anion transporter family member 2B1-like [Branchiostoma floridae]
MYFTAGLVIPLLGAGFVAGGFVTRRLSIRGTIKFCMIVCAVTSGLFAGMLIHCPDTAPLAGADTQLTNGVGNDLNAACSSNCNCSRDLYQPVCGETQVTYLSPCHAGCTESGQHGFHNCTCVGGNGTATMGECSEDSACPAWKLPVAVAFYVLVAVGIALTRSPNAVVLMSLTEEEFKTITVAISETGKMLAIGGTRPWESRSRACLKARNGARTWECLSLQL